MKHTSQKGNNKSTTNHEELEVEERHMPYKGYGYCELVNRSSDELAESSASPTPSSGWWGQDVGARSIATHTPTSNIVHKNDDLIQTITISFKCSLLGC